MLNSTQAVQSSAQATASSDTFAQQVQQLFNAIKSNDTATAETLLNNDPDLINARVNTDGSYNPNSGNTYSIAYYMLHQSYMPGSNPDAQWLTVFSNHFASFNIPTTMVWDDSFVHEAMAAYNYGVDSTPLLTQIFQRDPNLLTQVETFQGSVTGTMRERTPLLAAVNMHNAGLLSFLFNQMTASGMSKADIRDELNRQITSYDLGTTSAAAYAQKYANLFPDVNNLVQSYLN